MRVEIAPLCCKQCRRSRKSTRRRFFFKRLESGAGGNCFAAGDTAVEFGLIDPRILRVTIWSDLSHSECRGEASERGVLRIVFVCQLTGEEDNVCGEQFSEHERFCVPIMSGLLLWLSSCTSATKKTSIKFQGCCRFSADVSMALAHLQSPI